MQRKVGLRRGGTRHQPSDNYRPLRGPHTVGGAEIAHSRDQSNQAKGITVCQREFADLLHLNDGLDCRLLGLDGVARALHRDHFGRAANL